jgi:hypothetical protein
MVAVDVCVPEIKLGKVRKFQWMNSTVIAQLKTLKETYKHYLRTRSDADYNLYARARNQAKKFCRTSVKTMKELLLTMQKRTRKPSFCTLVRSVRQTTESLIPN